MAARLAVYDGYNVSQIYLQNNHIIGINIHMLRIPVWIINATYMGPVTLYLYFRYGRPSPPSSEGKGPSCHQANGAEKASGQPSPAEQNHHDRHEQPTELSNTDNDSHPQPHCCDHESSSPTSPTSEPAHPPSSTPSEDSEKQPTNTEGMSHCHTTPTPRPFWATVLIGVSHCGAGLRPRRSRRRMARLRHRRLHRLALHLARAPNRLRLRAALRHRLPVLQYRAHELRVRAPHRVARCEGGCAQLDEL